MSSRNLASHEITTNKKLLLQFPWFKSRTGKREEQLCCHALGTVKCRVLNIAARHSLVSKYIRLNQKIFASIYFNF